MTAEELHAWDMYFASITTQDNTLEMRRSVSGELILGSYFVSEEKIQKLAAIADLMLIERRKRYENIDTENS